MVLLMVHPQGHQCWFRLKNHHLPFLNDSFIPGSLASFIYFFQHSLMHLILETVNLFGQIGKTKVTR